MSEGRLGLIIMTNITKCYTIGLNYPLKWPLRPRASCYTNLELLRWFLFIFSLSCLFMPKANWNCLNINVRSMSWIAWCKTTISIYFWPNDPLIDLCINKTSIVNTCGNLSKSIPNVLEVLIQRSFQRNRKWKKENKNLFPHNSTTNWYLTTC